jgi:hypothetical protein
VSEILKFSVCNTKELIGIYIKKRTTCLSLEVRGTYIIKTSQSILLLVARIKEVEMGWACNTSGNCRKWMRT